MCADYAAFGIVGTMPNPGICRMLQPCRQNMPNCTFLIRHRLGTSERPSLQDEKTTSRFARHTRLVCWAEHLNTYTTLLKERGYALGSIQGQVQLITRFLAWVRTRHIELGSLDVTGVRQFLRYTENARRTVRSSGTATLNRFLHMLREQGVIPPQKERPLSSQQQLIKDYERYLLEKRGLTRATILNNVDFIDQFLSTRFRGLR